MRNTLNSEVLVIIDGKPQKGTIAEIFSPGAGRISLGKNGSILATHSPTFEEGTFHYPDEQRDVASNPKTAAEKPNHPAAPPAKPIGEK
jgi:hypothetical protein